MWRRVIFATLAVAVAACVSPAPTTSSASATPTVVRITADDAARAMAGDHFYSDYGQAILVISGRVGDIIVTGNNSRIALATSTAAVVICETFGAPDVKTGDAISVRVRASD
ncbi:MAG TPA: hypothetical protein VLI88_01095, partial [Patescibacteria group bacterium]|nr:hypothetical protein [Patescibacteria group bacterium]